MPSEAIHNHTFDSWTVAEIRPYFEAVYELFGAERMMWGGNWFFCLLATHPSEWAAASRQLIVDLSAAEQASILGGTAKNTYRLQG